MSLYNAYLRIYINMFEVVCERVERERRERDGIVLLGFGGEEEYSEMLGLMPELVPELGKYKDDTYMHQF